MRHPLERLLSAYRHVFERDHGYEDQYIIVPSMREFLGDKFKKMSWPQFVDMIIDNSLDQHSELGIITIYQLHLGRNDMKKKVFSPQQPFFTASSTEGIVIFLL